MNAKSRRKIEMGRRALDFSRANPDSSPGYTVAVNRLEERLARADQLARQQREGLLEVRAATARKRDLRRLMKRAQLAHLTRVAKVASREVPEVAEKFLLKPGTTTYLAFQTAARAIADEARNQQEILAKYGLVETALESLVQSLDQFDAAVEQGAVGRRAHVGASAQLQAVADEIVQMVGAIGGLNHYRFVNDAELLAAWESASNVLATPRPTPAPQDPTPPTEGDIRPAA